MKRIGLILCCVASVWAADADERQQVRAERARIEADFDRRLSECYQKLNVNDCRRDTQLQRSEHLQPIIARERELDARARKANADAQRARSAEKQRAQQQRILERAGAESGPAQPPTPRQP